MGTATLGLWSCAARVGRKLLHLPCRRGSLWQQCGGWRQNQDLGPAEGGALTTGLHFSTVDRHHREQQCHRLGSAVGRHPMTAWLGAVGQHVLMPLSHRWCRPVLVDSGATCLQLAGLS